MTRFIVRAYKVIEAGDEDEAFQIADEELPDWWDVEEVEPF